MPIYEYECSGCLKRFERLENISQNPVIVCPECGKETQRLVSKPARFVVDNSSLRISDPKTGHCGTQSPCCGRETRCDDRHCN